MSLINLKVGARLGLGFGTVLLLLCIITGVGVERIISLNQDVERVTDDKVPKLVIANDWVVQVLETARHMRNVFILDDHEKIKAELASIFDEKKKRAELMAELDKIVNDVEAKRLLGIIEEKRAAYIPHEDEFLKLAEAEQFNEAKLVLLEKARPAQLEYITALDKFIDFQKGLVRSVGEEAKEHANSGKNSLLALGIAALLLGIVFAWLIARSIIRPLQEAVKVADAVAKGDLTQRIEVKSADETGQLLQALKDMNESLVGIIGDVRGSTDSITTASQEIAQGNADLSQRTEEQASSLEETASSMEELTSTVKQNTENAKQANQLAANASDIAVMGGKVVGDVVQTMASISTSSKKIVDIISVIEGIAFQTNILALNAAVEAARAGEQGRGFAVVAGEVRNLAQRSAAAAKEIKTLIDDSVAKVDAGSKQVDHAGVTMSEIVTAVKRVTDIMSEIAAASNEQSAGIEQVNQAIIQMDEVTQQNAALVEEAAAAAEAMQEQAGVLMEAVSIFKLETSSVIKRSTAPEHVLSHRALTPSKHGNHSPVQTKSRKLIANKEDNDGDWKEFYTLKVDSKPLGARTS